MELPLLFLVDLLHPRRFEQRVPAFWRVRLEEGALVQVGAADVDVLLGDVVHRQLLGLGALLGTVLGQLKRRAAVTPRLFGCKRNPLAGRSNGSPSSSELPASPLGAC